MKVNEFIEFLQTQPQDIEVAFTRYSEQCLLKIDDIGIYEMCKPRGDGWVQDKRPDKETVKYLLLPGN